MTDENSRSIRINGNLKKRVMQGGVGVSIIALLGILMPMINGQGDRISALERSRENICVKVKALEKLPDKIDTLQDDIKNLEKLMILCNKDNPDLIKYLELNK